MTLAESAGSAARTSLDWLRQNPVNAFLLATLLGVFTYFYAIVPLFSGLTILQWGLVRWKPEYNQEHSKLVPFIFLFLLWYHRDALARAKTKGSNWGLLFIVLGAVLFVIGARALQARLSLAALPFLVFGVLLFVWGRQVARILLFPSAFLFFLVPLNAIEQATLRLQVLITDVVERLAMFFGIQVYSIGTTLRPVAQNWGFEISDNCSGIRSLIAMTMITAIYVHLAERELWKKGVIFALSIVYAIIGNIGRIFTIIILAQLGFAKFAGGLFHDWAPFIIFPFALGGMLLTSKLLNLRVQQVKESARSLTSTEKVTYDY